MIVGGLASKFQVCTVNFLVFWGSGKFGLERGTGGDPPPLGWHCHIFLPFFISWLLLGLLLTHRTAEILSLFRIIWQIWTSDSTVAQNRGEMNSWLFAKLLQYLNPANCGENRRKTFCFPAFGENEGKTRSLVWNSIGLHCFNFHTSQMFRPIWGLSHI